MLKATQKILPTIIKIYIEWTFLMCKFKFEVVENIFWQTEQVVFPLCIPKWL